VALIVGACATSPRVDNAAILQDFQNQRSHIEVTGDGTVTRILPDQTGPSGPHEQFLVRLSADTLTVRIEHNVSIAPRAPVAVGDRVTVHGEYIWTPDGGLIHFTHHDPAGKREGGYIELNGKRYN